MELSLVRRIAAEQKIGPEQVVREQWEMTLLKELMASTIGNRLVFKGGTALRLAWGSPRYSDDLVFSLTASVPPPEFRVTAERLLPGRSEVVITDLAAKSNTLLAEFRIRDEALERAFRIVIEVSRREPGQQESELRLLTSPCSPLTVLARVATLEEVWREKLQALRSRNAPRDLFDLWFLAQKLKRELPELPQFDARILRRDLRKYLPQDYYPIVEQLAQR